MSRPSHIPDSAEKVGDVFLWHWPGSRDVHFEEEGGVEGYFNEGGLTLEVGASERGTGGGSLDTPYDRTLPGPALRRVLEMWDTWENDEGPTP